MNSPWPTWSEITKKETTARKSSIEDGVLDSIGQHTHFYPIVTLTPRNVSPTHLNLNKTPQKTKQKKSHPKSPLTTLLTSQNSHKPLYFLPFCTIFWRTRLVFCGYNLRKNISPIWIRLQFRLRRRGAAVASVCMKQLHLENKKKNWCENFKFF